MNDSAQRRLGDLKLVKIEKAPPLYTEVARKLEQWVITQGLNKGDALPSERVLAKLFEASRPTIRLALSQLANQGLIEIGRSNGKAVRCSGHRALVKHFERFYIYDGCTHEQLLRVRSLIEPEMVYEAAQHATTKQIMDLKQIARQMENIKSAEDCELAAELDRRFHEKVAEVTDNPLLLVLESGLQKVMQTWLRAQFKPNEITAYKHMHWMLFEAISQKKADAARKLMNEHLVAAREALAHCEKMALGHGEGTG